MDIIKKIEDLYLREQYNGDDEGAYYEEDEELFQEIVDFLLDLDEDLLDDDMLERYVNILDKLDIEYEEDEEDVSEVRVLKRSSQKARRLARLYYRKNRAKIAAKRKRLAAKRKRLAAMGRGLSGKKLGLTKRVGS